MGRCLLLKPKPGCKLQQVGLRPTLLAKASKFRTQVCPLNLRDGTVRVHVSGGDEEGFESWVKSGQVDLPITTADCTDYDVEPCEEKLPEDYYLTCAVNLIADQINKIIGKSQAIDEICLLLRGPEGGDRHG